MSDIRISSYASMLANAAQVQAPRKTDAASAAAAAFGAVKPQAAEEAKPAVNLLANNEGRGKLVDILV